MSSTRGTSRKTSGGSTAPRAGAPRQTAQRAPEPGGSARRAGAAGSSRSAARSADRSTDRSADRSTDRSANRSTDRSADRSTDRSANRSGAQSKSRAEPGAESKKSASVTPLARELAETFFTLLMLHRARYRAMIAETGLSAAQLQVVMVMGEGPMSMRELAEAALTEPSNLTGIVDKLEARGLLQRKASTKDRRSKQVAPTRSGVAFRQKLLDHVKEPVPWMTGLVAADQKDLLEILRRAIVLAQRGLPADAGEHF